jgi:NAD(P)H dehydrogenase (quinone)
VSRPIGVTGATGAVGGRVAALLSARGLIQRLIVRDTERAPLLIAAEVRHGAGYADGPSMRAAFAGVGTLLLVPAAEAADRVEQHRTVVDAAVAAGVERIVYLSYLGAAPDATFTLARDHWATEEHVRASGVPWTFARMSLYLDFLPRMVGADGVLRGPAGEGRVAPVLRDDVARAVAELAAGQGHEARTYDLTGPRAITLGEAAAAIAELSGKPIRFEDETLEEAYASRASYGAPDWEVEAWVSTYTAIAAGELDVVSDDVQRLTGRPPVGVEDWLRERPDTFAHVGAAR